MNTKSYMRAAILEKPRKFKIVDVKKTEPGPNEVCVRLEGCGVCASNIIPWLGKPWFSYPFKPGAPGHEGWGRIFNVGENVTNLQSGDRVGLLSSHAFAEFDIVNKNAVVKLPKCFDNMPFPAEPLGCAMNIFKRAQISSSQIVAVVGVGFLGALLIQLAAAAGATVIGISRRPAALKHALYFGATVTLTMDHHEKIIRQVREITNGKLCDIVVEATGSQWPLDISAEITAERGRLVIAGYHQDGPRQVNMQLWNWRGLDVINAHERENAAYISGMHAAINAMMVGQLDPVPLFTHTYRLDQINEAFEHTIAHPGDFMKALLQV